VEGYDFFLLQEKVWILKLEKKKFA